MEKLSERTEKDYNQDDNSRMSRLLQFIKKRILNLSSDAPKGESSVYDLLSPEEEEVDEGFTFMRGGPVRDAEILDSEPDKDLVNTTNEFQRKCNYGEEINTIGKSKSEILPLPEKIKEYFCSHFGNDGIWQFCLEPFREFSHGKEIFFWYFDKTTKKIKIKKNKDGDTLNVRISFSVKKDSNQIQIAFSDTRYLKEATKIIKSLIFELEESMAALKIPLEISKIYSEYAQTTGHLPDSSETAPTHLQPDRIAASVQSMTDQLVAQNPDLSPKLSEPQTAESHQPSLEISN